MTCLLSASLFIYLMGSPVLYMRQNIFLELNLNLLNLLCVFFVLSFNFQKCFFNEQNLENYFHLAILNIKYKKLKLKSSIFAKFEYVYTNIQLNNAINKKKKTR